MRIYISDIYICEYYILFSKNLSSFSTFGGGRINRSLGKTSWEGLSVFLGISFRLTQSVADALLQQQRRSNTFAIAWCVQDMVGFSGEE